MTTIYAVSYFDPHDYHLRGDVDSLYVTRAGAEARLAEVEKIRARYEYLMELETLTEAEEAEYEAEMNEQLMSYDIYEMILNP